MKKHSKFKMRVVSGLPRYGRRQHPLWKELFAKLSKLNEGQGIRFVWPKDCHICKDRDGYPALSSALNYHATQRGYRVSYSAKDFPVVYVWKQRPVQD